MVDQFRNSLNEIWKMASTPPKRAPLEQQLQQATQMNAAAVRSPQYPLSKLTYDKAHAAICAVANALPFAVTNKILSISFDSDDNPISQRSFKVQFYGGRAIVFDNIDTFPSEADIVRICLECP